MAEDLADYLLEMGDQDPLPALRGRDPRARRDPARPAARRVRRGRRHQPAARGPRPAGGVARLHPRRRQGGLPAVEPVAHPDHRPRRPARRRPRHHVRRQGHREHADRHRRDVPPPRDPAGVQRGARHRADGHPQGDSRHHRQGARDGRGARPSTRPSRSPRSCRRTSSCAWSRSSSRR